MAMLQLIIIIGTWSVTVFFFFFCYFFFFFLTFIYFFLYIAVVNLFWAKLHCSSNVSSLETGFFSCMHLFSFYHFIDNSTPVFSSKPNTFSWKVIVLFLLEYGGIYEILFRVSYNYFHEVLTAGLPYAHIFKS